MKRGLPITVLVDDACVADDDPDFADASRPSTEHHVIGALRGLGYAVRVLRVNGRVEDLVAGLREQAPALVFNLTEQFRDSRCLDKNVAALLELLGLPFTGTGCAGLLLCRDKGLCKQLLNARRIHVPRFALVRPGRTARLPAFLSFPVVVKPLYEDGSDGISNASLVRDQDGFAERVRYVHTRWRQPAIAEEYVDGRELYVSLIGNRRVDVLAPREVAFGDAARGGPVLATSRVKSDPEYQQRWGIAFRFAEIEERLWRDLARICRKAYRLLQMSDYGRIDLRVTPQGRIVVLEANPNPDLARGDEVAESAERSGIPYAALIERIVRLALRRWRGSGGVDAREGAREC